MILKGCLSCIFSFLKIEILGSISNIKSHKILYSVTYLEKSWNDSVLLISGVERLKKLSGNIFLNIIIKFLECSRNYVIVLETNDRINRYEVFPLGTENFNEFIIINSFEICVTLIYSAYSQTHMPRFV